MERVVLDIGSGPHPKADATHLMDIHQWTENTKFTTYMTSLIHMMMASLIKFILGMS